MSKLHYPTACFEVISVGKIINIYYFLEDRAHEVFITNFVKRIADEYSVEINNRVLSGRGGNKFVSEFKKFIKYYSTLKDYPDLIIIVRDADCKNKSDCVSYQTRVNELTDLYKEHSKLLNISLFCIPCPYIERWLSEDLKAIKSITGSININDKPFICEKGYYKSKLKELFKDFDSITGLEYASDIVERLDIDLLCNRDPNFQKFLTDLRNAFRHIDI
jgi:hypothetical protein